MKLSITSIVCLILMTNHVAAMQLHPPTRVLGHWENKNSQDLLILGIWGVTPTRKFTAQSSANLDYVIPLIGTQVEATGFYGIDWNGRIHLRNSTEILNPLTQTYSEATLFITYNTYRRRITLELLWFRHKACTKHYSKKRCPMINRIPLL